MLGDPVGGVDPKGLCVNEYDKFYKKIAFGVCKNGSTSYAVNYYFDKRKKPIYLSHDTIQALLNSYMVKRQIRALKGGKAKILNGNFSVDLTLHTFHVGDTGVVFNTYCSDKQCITYFIGFVQAGRGKSCASEADSFSDPFDIGIESSYGVPFYYIPYSWHIIYKNNFKQWDDL